LRRRHFPPERNVVPAHLTLFHALPGDHRSRISRELDLLCRELGPITLRATGYKLLGRGVALALNAPELVSLRQALQREWSDWLTPQDSAPFQPHVTIQNKVAPNEAKTLKAELDAGFRPHEIRGEGLQLWHYRGGPWELARRYRFAG
jgi:2'-5' RNA ligase